MGLFPHDRVHYLIPLILVVEFCLTWNGVNMSAADFSSYHMSTPNDENITVCLSADSEITDGLSSFCGFRRRAALYRLTV